MQLHYVDVIDRGRVSERFICAVIGPLRLTGLVHDQYRFDIQNGGAVAWGGRYDLRGSRPFLYGPPDCVNWKSTVTVQTMFRILLCNNG